MNIHFVLVEPRLPENVGACARAIKTMGFSSFKLVNPCDHLQARAKWVAHGSADILEHAVVYRSLNEAVSGMDLTIAATAKPRTVKTEFYSADRVPDLINN
ncbi:TrmH family RNA methyltransferase, partial [Fibrobacterota bacterium]